VLLAFGSMTLTPNQVRWGSGQASPYTLVSTEGGYLLRLEANPSFYDNQNQYIKLIPKAAANGIPESLDVAFYTDASQLPERRIHHVWWLFRRVAIAVYIREDINRAIKRSNV
jgi:hypothetical protein